MSMMMLGPCEPACKGPLCVWGGVGGGGLVPHSSSVSQPPRQELTVCLHSVLGAFNFNHRCVAIQLVLVAEPQAVVVHQHALAVKPARGWPAQRGRPTFCIKAPPLQSPPPHPRPQRLPKPWLAKPPAKTLAGQQGCRTPILRRRRRVAHPVVGGANTCAARGGGGGMHRSPLAGKV